MNDYYKSIPNDGSAFDVYSMETINSTKIGGN